MAFGAISYYLDRIVTGRLVKYTYGAMAWVDFDILNPEHRRRSEKKQLGAAGDLILETFVPILSKVSSVQQVHRHNLPPGFLGDKGV